LSAITSVGEQMNRPFRAARQLGINLSSLRGYEAFQPRGSARHFAGHARYRHISTIEITNGSIDESLAHPRDISACYRANRLLL
jgi:hypothetical protein